MALARRRVAGVALALAFGVSSGAGAESGLITAIVAGIVAAVFGGSNIQVSGPTGAMVVVLGPIVAAHGPGTVWLQSLPFSRLAEQVIRHAPSVGGSRKEQSSLSGAVGGALLSGLLDRGD